MARALSVRAVSVDYRLAPEFPFPAGLDDAVAVINGLVAEGISPHDLVVGGDSAGGGLATALMMRLRDEGHPQVAGAILLSPWLDLTGTSDAMETVGESDPMLNPGGLRLAAAAYAGDDIKTPYASPLFGDAHHLPPLLVFAGTLDILVDDTRTFATIATSAGVDIETHVEDGLMHVWPFVDGLPEAAVSLGQMADWYQRHFA
jgi:acetyl esterase/lipase